MQYLRESIGTFWRRAVTKLLGTPRGIPYWEARAAQFGARAVFNLSHSEQDMDAVTAMQVQEIFPQLKAQLNGAERTILDYGCGPGRFTPRLARTIGGEAIGVDPIESLIALAPRDSNTRYELLGKGGRIPMADASADVVWICLVLGGIPPRSLPSTIQEIHRVLKPGGLLFLVECTPDKPSTPHWAFHSVAEYQAMFPFARLEHLHDYYDVEERISIMAGRTVSKAGHGAIQNNASCTGT